MARISDPRLLCHEYEELFTLQEYGVPTKTAWEAFCGQTLTNKETGGHTPSKIYLNRNPYEISLPEELRVAVVRN